MSAATGQKDRDVNSLCQYRDRAQISPAHPRGGKQLLFIDIVGVNVHSCYFCLLANKIKCLKAGVWWGCTANTVKNPDLSFYKLPN